MKHLKYKALDPKHTVINIKNILNNLKIETEEKWSNDLIEGCFSVRIYVKGTNIFQSGKGTSKDFALASGYAEFMERLQTGFLYQLDYDNDTMNFGNFFYSPDEMYVNIKDAVKLGGKLLSETIKYIEKEDSIYTYNIEEEIKKWIFDSPLSKQNKLVLLPYMNMITNEIEYLPTSFIKHYYFTNGSCAGNIREEALVQGLSEICERYISQKVLNEKLSLPEIPDEVLRQVPELYEIIEKLRKFDYFNIKIMDASLEKGFPVVAAVLVDNRYGSYVIRFGSHPKFEIAFERCITELFQLTQLDQMQFANKFDFLADGYALSYENQFNFSKCTVGIYPSSFFKSIHDFKYTPFQDVSNAIPKQLDFMKNLLQKNGFDIYIRDCSFLGFPSYHVICPGKSMLFNFGNSRFVEKKLLHDNLSFLRGQTGVAGKIDDLLVLLDYKQGWLFDKRYDFTSKIPVYPKVLGVPLIMTRINIILLLHFKRYKEIKDAFLYPTSFDTSNGYIFSNQIDRIFLQVIEGIILKIDRNELKKMLMFIFDRSLVEKIFLLIENPLQYLPKLTCFNCDSCEYSHFCHYSIIKNIKLRCKSKYKEWVNKSKGVKLNG